MSGRHQQDICTLSGKDGLRPLEQLEIKSLLPQTLIVPQKLLFLETLAPAEISLLTNNNASAVHMFTENKWNSSDGWMLDYSIMFFKHEWNLSGSRQKENSYLKGFGQSKTTTQVISKWQMCEITLIQVLPTMTEATGQRKTENTNASLVNHIHLNPWEQHFHLTVQWPYCQYKPWHHRICHTQHFHAQGWIK